ncbi:class I SAM-dependent methyltransferase [Mesorhizobium sp. NBSH29]|uniref:class I SAM-dependent methyltransferase n=1 Tax=Mesorhizobium sp. NBSH29 TaxID=2654249 RepID=UPI00189677C9|nr:class I SAM-dependent methyltransferase [Mesorhizobium sp. NBSH29]QPC86051.1 class I SAM-dependent methyltransferase [Mesorhizobium sp. NBSH29]
MTGSGLQSDLDVPADIGPFHDVSCGAIAAESAGPLETAFYGHRGRIVHKWHHYLPLYDRYFAAFRGASGSGALHPTAKLTRPVRMLEIGVSKGGSMELWREYFGPDAILYGIDIDPACAAFDGEAGNKVRIGSQDDPAFLKRVVAEMGGIDIVLDDGSHVAKHQKESFDTLFPLLETGGLYVVEDLHTAYWREFGGGYDSKESFIATVKQLIDDLHHWYHCGGERIGVAAGLVGGVHIHDSIAFIEKSRVATPAHSQRGIARG